jgi:SAM-dependent methyltransferase
VRTQGSVSFDRAAGYYDRTRALPPELAAAQTALVAEQVRRRAGPCLEIGVGTGRIALPLAAAGCRVVGIDLSAAMLGRLRAKDPGASVPVVRADATALPFAAGSFGTAVACHVLHLVSDWVVVVDELARVVVPGGVLLVARGAARDGLLAEVNARIRAEAGARARAGALDGLDQLDAYLSGRGAVVEHLPELERSATEPGESLAAYLAQAANGVYSWTWEIPPERLNAAVAATRAWATAIHGDLDRLPAPVPPVRWRRYVLPGNPADA